MPFTCTAHKHRCIAHAYWLNGKSIFRFPRETALKTANLITNLKCLKACQLHLVLSARCDRLGKLLVSLLVSVPKNSDCVRHPGHGLDRVHRSRLALADGVPVHLSQMPKSQKPNFTRAGLLPGTRCRRKPLASWQSFSCSHRTVTFAPLHTFAHRPEAHVTAVKLSDSGRFALQATCHHRFAADRWVDRHMPPPAGSPLRLGSHSILCSWRTAPEAAAGPALRHAGT